MKNKNLTKIAIATILLGATQLASAQWAVTNVNDIQNRNVWASIKGAVDQVRASVDSLSTLTERMQFDNDTRLRIALGQADIAKKDVAAMPTLRECVELTNKTVNASEFGKVVSASNKTSRGGGGGSSGPSATKNPGSQSPSERSKQITATLSSQAQTLATKASLGTCSADLPDGVECNNDNGKFAGGDIYITGIKTNMEDSAKQNSFKNFTMNDAGYKVAQKNINDSTLYDAPKKLPVEQLKRNPIYASLYNTMYARLMVSNDTLHDITKLRKEAEGDLGDSTPVGKMWAKAASNYPKIFGANGIKHPGKKPSLFEMLNYNVYNDYLGVPEEEKPDEEFFRKNMLEKAALANFIAWKNYEQQENTNILLANILVQLTTPITKQTLETEYTRTTGTKN